MSAPPPTTYLARTFGWTGSRQEWVAAAGVVAWLAAGVAVSRYAQRLSIGEAVLLYGVWLLSLVAAARDAVRNLFGPVFFHDIVRTGRQRLTFGLRLLYVSFVGFVMLMMYYAWLTDTVHYFNNPNPIVGTNELSRFGTEFFQTFVVIQFLAVVLLTPVYVAGTICVEKERKTLEFLFATDLRNREIVFGKLASRVVTLLMFTLIGLPILTLVQLFGGVDPEQVLAAFVATVTTVIGLAAVGIWFSTMLKKARDAIMLTYLSYAAYCFASLFAAAYTNIAPFKGWWNTPVNLGFVSVGLNDVCWRAADGNIGWQLLVMGNAGRLGSGLGDQLARYVLFWAVVGGLFLGHAILRLRAVALNQSYGSPGGTRGRKKKVVTTAGTVEKVVVNERARRLPAVGDDPMFWKEVFVDGAARGGVLGRIVAGLIVALLFIPLATVVYAHFFDNYYRGGDLWTRFREDVNGWVRGATGVVTALIALGAAVRGAGAITHEKDKDSWVSLLSTPLSADEILLGKWWGVVLGLRRPFFLLVLVWSIGLLLGAANPVMVVLTAALVLLYTAAFAWVGLYFSMTARNTMVATVRGFFAALFLIGGFWIVVWCCCVLPMAFNRSGREFEPVGQFFLGLTPPFVAGWMPMNELRRREYGPFEPDDHGIGLAAPVLGVMIWAGFTVFLWLGCLAKFRMVTNREPQEDVSRSWVLKPEERRSEKPREKQNRYE